MIHVTITMCAGKSLRREMMGEVQRKSAQKQFTGTYVITVLTHVAR